MCVLTMQDGSHSKVKSKFVDIMWKEEDRSEIMCVLTMQDWSHSKVKSQKQRLTLILVEKWILEV